METQAQRDPLEPRGALLHPRTIPRALRIRRLPPGPLLAPFVRHYWLIDWDLDGSAPYVQRTLTHPAANLVFEGEQAMISGVATRRFDKVIEGRGRVLGVLFRPAGFQPFYRGSMHVLTDRTVPVRTLFPGDIDALRQAVLGTSVDEEVHDQERVQLVEAFLGEQLPEVDPEGQWIDAVMDRAERDRSLGTAEELATSVGVSLRTLQRQMRHYVGVGPKWVLRRFRLHEAADRLARGEPMDHSLLARALGYYDQAHFVRDFTAVVGSPPGRYAAAARG